MRIKTHIVVDMSADMPIRQYFIAKQNEHNGRVLMVELTNKGCPTEIPENTDVYLACMKPDGTYAEIKGSVTSGVAEFELSAQALAVTGTVLCEVRLFSPENESLVMSSSFEMRVLPSVIPGDAINSVNDFLAYIYSAGKKTEDGGEIFGDYENNLAISPFTASFGSNNVAGSRAFTILALDAANKTYTLDGVDGLEVGDVYSAHLYNQVENYGKITKIEPLENRVTVDRFFADRGVIYTPQDSIIKENGYDYEKNTFRIIKKPFVGTRKIGCGALVAGDGNFVLSKNGLSIGQGNITGGSHAATIGRNSYAAYAAIAAGCECLVYGFASLGAGQDVIIRPGVWEGFGFGCGLRVNNSCQLVLGRYNAEDKDKKLALIIGNGTADNDRSNAFEVDFDGNAYAGGSRLVSEKKLSEFVGSFAVTPYIDGISAAFSVELDFPVIYDTWRIYVEGNDLGGAIAKGEPFVTAPVIFDNEDIVVELERKNSVVMSVRLVKLNEVGKIKYGKLIPEVEEDE